MSISDLPAVNATLNGTSAVLLSAGWICIKTGRKIAHRNLMIAAFCTSTVFLVCYLIYHEKAGRTEFHNPEWFRPYYLALLLTHTLLAVVIVPMILVTMSRALKERFDKHRAIARWTWPLWMYVSVTGVIIYWLLYVKFPQH